MFKRYISGSGIFRFSPFGKWALPLALLGALAQPSLARASEPEQDGEARPRRSTWARIDLQADLQNLFLYRNDSDFDRSDPLYDASGQTVGAFATLFTPRVSLEILEHLRIVYEVELGLNFWSKQNPDQQDPTAGDIFVLKHREIFGEGLLLDNSLGFKVGYSRFSDPSGLFLNHWIGVAQAWFNWSDDLSTGVFVGQVPDQTFEGILITDNNFTRDIWVFGAESRVVLADWMLLTAAVSGLYDSHLVDRTRWLLTPSARLQLSDRDWGASVEAALQAGQYLGHALDNSDQTVVAWAAQGSGWMRLGDFRLGANLLFLSPDDAHELNNTQHAFLYSGKNRSATVMLTEDEVRDWYDNLDERMSSFNGGFHENRAGLFVGDVKASYQALEWLNVALILGAATVLKPENAGGETLLGAETDLLLTFTFSDYLVGQMLGGVMLPGTAAGRLLPNAIDTSATDPIGMLELSLTLRY